MEGFSTISLRLKEMYQMITMGGNAELELVDSLDPFSEGILFSVMPPKKSWKNISNLSGGEKTLSSLALVFALHHYKPTPLYVMDEIDAALDFRNVCLPLPSLTATAVRLDELTDGDGTGVHCGELHQGTDEERTVYCYFTEE
jgi:structural maintenance of chromosome 4